jgi:hypothetical protein
MLSSTGWSVALLSVARGLETASTVCVAAGELVGRHQVVWPAFESAFWVFQRSTLLQQKPSTIINRVSLLSDDLIVASLSTLNDQ